MIKNKISILLLTAAFSTYSVNLFSQENPDVVSNKQLIEQSSLNINVFAKDVLGANKNSTFSFYLPNYFAFGKDDLKLQFSGKYRVAKKANIYLAYTQLMFWNIYDASMPFEEINYNPEIFYRILEDQTNYLRSLDIGVLHTSNGEDGAISRSINRAYVKLNGVRKIDRFNLITLLQFHYIFNRDSQSEHIHDYLGYWDLKMALTHLITHNKQHLDLEFRIYAGKRFFNFDKGAREIGLLYNFESENFNPNIYFQYFSGYGENLLFQNKKQESYRLGLSLSI